MFNAEGASLDATIPDLTQDKLDEYLHRSMVARNGAAPIARVWLLADDATFAAVNPVIAAEAIELVLAGKAIVILGRAGWITGCAGPWCRSKGQATGCASMPTSSLRQCARDPRQLQRRKSAAAGHQRRRCPIPPSADHRRAT